MTQPRDYVFVGLAMVVVLGLFFYFVAGARGATWIGYTISPTLAFLTVTWLRYRRRSGSA